MPASLLIGSFLTAFSLPVSVFLIFCSSKPQLLIITATSCVFWLFSLFLSSFLLFLFSPLSSSFNDTRIIVPISTFIQECMRIAFIRAYFPSARSFSLYQLNALLFPLSDLNSAIAAGVGFSLCHVFSFYGQLLISSGGPGALYSPNCNQFSLFTSAALTGGCFSLMEISLMITAFDAIRRGIPARLGIVIGFHLAAALTTLWSFELEGCVMSLPLLFFLSVLSLGMAGWTILQNDYISKKRI